ncbi:hypothetical protein EXE58_04090 [Nocardioides seonyuensis]|uniref:Fibronectin type-III domain-containing protein n=1 Tax=Nocardioides seonyuensis TaxID=2518371 RepID=A0A4P7ICC3_9ACTN|nr:Ig-like domain-containing protein [Nocardioides seonyuensis]QBX54726.1 hypothetical protein EXE58_04090 [Nocardioides seonyuensis]
MRRHRAALASGTALALATGLVVAYAVTADGYKAHRADLNDGGVWVVNNHLGVHGRINKPINQLDGVVYDEGPKLRLDVVQDGAAVVTLNRGSNRGRGVDPGLLEFADGGTVAVPAAGDVQMGGGTLATIDATTGKLWATRYDPQLGRPLVNTVDRQADETAEVGEAAALAVSTQGTVVATSGVEATVSRLSPAGDGLAKPEVQDLPRTAGSPTSVTTVGERVVTLDETSGQLAVLGGAATDVPEDSILQQPGPDAAEVLVATRSGLLSVDLDSGEQEEVASATGTPVEPVRLGACVYGAWSGGGGDVAQQCGSDPVRVNGLGGNATNLAFRVNRGEIVLNDATSGRVWDVQEDKPFKIDNWDSYTARKKVEDEQEQDEQDSRGDQRPPKAVDDAYGVRPARTTVLHPLDNDSAPAGRLLSIVSVDQPGGGSRVTIGPDGQTLQIQVPEEARPASFDYFIDDGRNLRAHATVRVQVRGEAENQQPAPREGYEPRQWHVPAGGSLSVPVLSDWRDDADGDALVLDSAVAVDAQANGAVARSTAEGRIRFTAPPRGGGVVKVDYGVSDGRSAPVTRTMLFEVQPVTDREGFPPVAEPDVVRGEVGKPIEIRPLANDLPGSDPTTPQAELALGGRIPDQADAEIRTDLESGAITFTSTKPGTYLLDYDAAYGNTPLSQSKIRVDVRPRPRRPEDPVAMPDTLMIYGQSPALVDVLANDLDPSGDLLVVQRAVADRAEQLDLAIVDGRWLRVAARGEFGSATQLVRYTVTNGQASVTGEVTVTQREQPADNTPITVTDRVVVRSGASVAAPVLDNDSSPSGDRLELRTDITERPGVLDVLAPRDYDGGPGAAFVAGRMVRFVAPVVKERETFEVPYAAVNAAGQSAPGRLLVTAVPASEPNSPPEPPTLEGRAVAGDVVTLRLRGSEVDPEGDPVAITGISSAPSFGRLLSTTANALVYQAYPGSAGTDEFEYAVVDTRGATSTGVARVAVVKPSSPQPPLAVDDELTVQPGRTATFDPLANDHVVAGEDPQIRLVNPTEGMELDADTGLVSVPAPESLDEPATQVVYSVSNGIDESRAVMTLRTSPDVENPPVVYDAYGKVQDSEAVSVDVLDGAYDPDGDAADIVVAEVYGDPASVSHTDKRVRATRTEDPQVIPFRVEDGQGTSATAQVFVPPTGHGLPFVRPGSLIEVESGESAKGRLSDHVENPAGGALRLTGRQGVHASPSQLQAQATGENTFEVRADAGYRGPGAVLVEVTTATDANGNEDAASSADGQTVLLSIPVQVGDDTPVLECPGTTIDLAPGESSQIDVQSLCKVWTQDPRDAAGLDYTAAWVTELEGLGVRPLGGSVFSVDATDASAGGGRAVLSLRAGDSDEAQLTFRVARAPQPRMLPIPVPDMRAGESRTIDLEPFLVPGVASPQPRVVSISQVSGDRSPASMSGSSITLRPSDDVEGRVVYRVVMSDVSSEDPPADRRAEGRVTFEVRGVPGAPTQVTPYPDDQTGEMRVGWYPPRDTGGSRITHYQVMELKTGDRQTCRQNECFFRGLKDGVRYRFKVRAHNAVDYGPWSETSREAFVDTRPSRVRNIRMVSRADKTIRIAWDKPASSTSKIVKYAISWSGGAGIEVAGDRDRVTIPGLDNNTTYVFSVQALNEIGWSDPRQSPVLQPLGTPAAPVDVSATDLSTGNAKTTVRVSWTGTSPEGPGPVVYTVYVSREGGSPREVPGCVRIQATSCNDARDYDGLDYTYTVRAQNSPSPEKPNTSPMSQGRLFEAVGKPAAWGNWSWTATGTSQEIQVSFTVPESRGQVSRVEILVNGSSVKTFANQTGSTTTRFEVGSNDAAWRVELRVCNEHAPTGCTTSPFQDVQSYGSLTSSLDDIPAAQVNGKNLSWLVTGTSNGNAAVLGISLNGGPEQMVRVNGVGRFSHQVTYTTEGYYESVSVRVRLYDDAPTGRGEDVSSRSDESGSPPPPSVNIGKGDSCMDGDEDQNNNCGDIIEPDCTNTSCAFVRYNVSGFLEDYSCTVSNSEYPLRSETNSHEGGTSASVQTDWYYDKGYVSITCSSGNGARDQRAQSGFDWPDPAP